MKLALIPLLLLAAVPAALRAQTVRFRLEGIGLTYQEVREGRDGFGAGGGVAVELRVKRFRLVASGYQAHVEPDDATATAFDLRQLDLRFGYALTPFFTLEVGGGRRYVDPEFATEEVGLLRAGVFSENQLNRLASVWVRGAYLLNPRFSGGGSADLAFEFGLGMGVGTANGRFRFQAEYEFQRIDRRVANDDVPLQVSLARTGIAIGF